MANEKDTKIKDPDVTPQAEAKEAPKPVKKATKKKTAKKKTAPQKEEKKSYRPKLVEEGESAVVKYSLLHRIDAGALYPPFKEKLIELLENCAKRGVLYVPTQGLRTFEEQNELYAQGRTKPGKIVTRAKGGQSNHNYGIAADCTFDTNPEKWGLQPEWKDEDYVVLAEEAKKLDLEAGFYWNFKDPPHVQLKLSRIGLDVWHLLHVYNNAGGLRAVWSLLSKYQW